MNAAYVTSAGEMQAVIAYADDPVVALREAADELQLYLSEETTGRTRAVVSTFYSWDEDETVAGVHTFGIVVEEA